LSAEREKSYPVESFTWTNNGCLSGKSLSKIAEFSRQRPKVGCGHYRLRLSSVQDYLVVTQMGRGGRDFPKQFLHIIAIELSFRGRLDEVLRLVDLGLLRKNGEKS
jgi:hypothetical protein